MPLIIDQPEEDLDSQVVLEVVSWIWAAKNHRQLIFASHNANLVVNGDAEPVAVCDYRRAGDQSGGKISQQGASDIPAVRHEITTVMEGGEKAFRLREEHMFLRMLSYYISWHMKQDLAPILFHDNDKPAANAKRADPVAAAQRSNTALAKASRKRTEDDYPVHSFTSMLADLATICANTIQPADDMPAFTMITTPTPLQRRAFELLGVSHRPAWRSQHTITKLQLSPTNRPKSGGTSA